MTAGTALQEKFFPFCQSFLSRLWGIGNRHDFVCLAFLYKLGELLAHTFQVKNQAPSIRLRKVFPRGQGGCPHTTGDSVEQILVGGYFTEGRRT